MDDVTKCNVCDMLYMAGLEEDEKAHQQQHAKLSTGVLPYHVRELMKKVGWKGCIENGKINDDYIDLIVFSWYSRALSNGLAVENFDDYIRDHREYVRAKVTNVNLKDASQKIEKWSGYAG